MSNPTKTPMKSEVLKFLTLSLMAALTLIKGYFELEGSDLQLEEIRMYLNKALDRAKEPS